MKTGTKEFQEIMTQFEKDIKVSSVPVSCDFRKESSDMNKNGAFYCNGEVNNLFNVYLMGYTYRTSIYNLESL